MSGRAANLCWLCGGWGNVAKHDTGEKSWRDDSQERYPIYSLLFAPGVVAIEDELIACPVCSPVPPLAREKG